ncbi:hypothetical protein K490DRAFT_38359 [Saccharata proteae CBS 121410]|uniref:Sterol regulatory element-binding protein cleavage-activating protein n=1 Tax=Saccharata proteae CBS 121410 TaxID=1314787 RepID=A0A6A5YDU5_9PEZI|nr:hypothetical protein K490DRAFT_38359 [Saccharata proteae CBS 121410]
MAKTKPGVGNKKNKMNGSNKKTKSDPQQLLAEAVALLHTSQPDEALVLARRALALLQPAAEEPTVAALPALNLLGEINVELGDAETAREYFLVAAALDESGAVPEVAGGGAEKFLWLAQLCEDGGAESVAWFDKGAEVLRREIGELEGKNGDDVELQLEEKKTKLANALCGVVEVYMTDLSWEEDAEAKCEALVTEALLIAPSSPETLQTLASVRISQLKYEDARTALKMSMDLWSDLEPEDPKVPDFPTRISLARLLMESELEEEAIDVLERLVLEDDSSVEAWYLGGWGLHLMAEKKKQAEDEDTVKALFKASRHWLLNSLKLYQMVEYEDDRLKDHAVELVEGLNKLLGPPIEGEEEEEWEELEEEREDEEMEGTTTEPPILSPEHPIRKAFSSYGTVTARHWLFSLLLSVAVAVLLCYPVLFLFESPTSVGYSLPRHVWTSARLFEGPLDTEPDIALRQVWVHGSYMKSLERHVLEEALEVQDRLIGRGFDNQGLRGLARIGEVADNRSGNVPVIDNWCETPVSRNSNWSSHSPLMYWNCSPTALEADTDILRTVNSQRDRRTSFNFTLRPPSVFAGKLFEGPNVVAADALVITLFERLPSTISEQWNERTMALAKEAPGRWSVYPRDGLTYRSQLYEFRYQPMSINDAGTLVMAYLLMFGYLLFSLRKLKAVKSVFGLFCTVISQMFISICASFTICGILKVNLSSVPGEAYPFVVLVIGLENMFRLINAVLESPPHMPTVTRIANALGDVGHLSLAATVQNLLILWMLSKVVSPGVAPACAFAAVALVFDFLFHLTFFVAVLSVDVRRMELQDSLDRINFSQQRRSSVSNKQERQTWSGAFMKGTVPFSTRIAGTVAMICFILTLNWHFFDHDNRLLSALHYVRYARSAFTRQSRADPLPAPPINQARTPEAWLRLQDHASAAQVIDFIHPGSHSFIARVYEPLTIVIEGADRTGAAVHTTSILHILRELAEKHLFPVVLLSGFAIAIIFLLMNYLLWNELPDDEQSEYSNNEEVPLSLKSLPRSHDLDVVKITTAAQGHLVSVGLDRTTSIWTASLTPPLWPIVATAIDDTGSWLALCNDSGRVALWSLNERQFRQFHTIELRGQMPMVCSFSFQQIDEVGRLSLVVVTPDGRLTNLDFRSGQSWTHNISQTSLSSATLVQCLKGHPKLSSCTRSGQIFVTWLEAGQWISEPIDLAIPEDKTSQVKYTVALPSLCMLAAVRTCQVDLIDLPTRTTVHAIPTGQIKGQSLRILHARRKTCGCHSPTVHTFSLVYTDLDTQNCIMQTYTPGDGATNGQICLRPPPTTGDEPRTCSGFDKSISSLHWMHRPGSWEAAGIPSIVGVRKRPSSRAPSVVSTASDTSYFALSSDGHFGALKRRIHDSSNGTTTNSKHPNSTLPPTSAGNTGPDNDDWEVWTMSMTGETHTIPLFPRSHADPVEEEDHGQLFVAKPGPLARLGKRSLAVAFGNAVKIVTLGTDRFVEDDGDMYSPLSADPAALALSWRRRGGGKRGVGAAVGAAM